SAAARNWHRTPSVARRSASEGMSRVGNRHSIVLVDNNATPVAPASTTACHRESRRTGAPDISGQDDRDDAIERLAQPRRPGEPGEQEQEERGSHGQLMAPP